MTMNRLTDLRTERFPGLNFRQLAEHHALGARPESAPEKRRLMTLAVREAEAIACESGVPELVLLSLAEEKVGAVRQWFVRQGELKNRRFIWPPAA